MTDDEPGRPGGSRERPARFFADAAQFRTWLERHHDAVAELWMGLYKKHVPDRGLTWADAVPEALCFGWIDSRAERIDDDAVRQRWSPRKPTSAWSAVNVAHVQRLASEGRMHPAGLAAFEARRLDRTAIYSYEVDDQELPREFADRLAANEAAARFLAAAIPSYHKIAVNWVVSAKQAATRDKRMTQLIEDSAAGRLIPTQRYGQEPGWVARARTSRAVQDPPTEEIRHA